MFNKSSHKPAEVVFRDELAQIKHIGVREFTIHCLNEAPVYWWTAHSSKVHHYPDERKKGGRILHAKRVSKVADMLCDAHSLGGIGRDYVMSAALLHDICVWGPMDEPKVEKAHPQHAAFAAKRVMQSFQTYRQHLVYKYGRITESVVALADVLNISTLIQTHMGRWGEEPPLTPMQWILHEADMVASRDYIMVIPFGKKLK